MWIRVSIIVESVVWISHPRSPRPMALTIGYNVNFIEETHMSLPKGFKLMSCGISH